MCSGRILVALIAASLAAACVSSDDASSTAGTWVGTITTEGNVTTVVNESGSVWGGAATLVEEASIGVAVGPEEYMLGEIAGLYATEDEIYVLEQSASKVRVYDLAGNHLRSFGHAGQGPGELGRYPRSISVGSDGRIYVADLANRRINIYSREGETAGELPLPARSAPLMAPMVFADDEGIWFAVRVPTEDGSSARTGFQVQTADGPVGDPFLVPEIDYERLFIRVQGRDVGSVPFAPQVAATFSYDRALIAGASDRYEFRMIHPTGETVLVERYWDPAPVTSEEAEYWRRFMLAGFRGIEVDWNGENIPDHKPAFMQFLPAASGEVWVLRQGGGGSGECDLEPEEASTSGFDQDIIACLYPNLFFDVFGRDGRYLGSVEGLQLNANAFPFINGETVIAPFQDDVGTIMVKRYRLVLPEDGEAR